jgi:hypothetical protein
MEPAEHPTNVWGQTTSAGLPQGPGQASRQAGRQGGKGGKEASRPAGAIVQPIPGAAGLLGVSRVTTVLIIDSDNGLGGP